MWLVVGSPQDAAALWACEGLRARGLDPVEWVDGEALAGARTWRHTLDDGACTSEIRLDDGRTLRDGAIRGVLNRMQGVPPGALQVAHRDDRDYAQQELFALMLSWMHALPATVVNRPTPQGLAGGWRHACEWVRLAGQAGLPSTAWRMGSRDAGEAPGATPGTNAAAQPDEYAILLDGRAFGPELPEAFRGGLMRLATLVDTPLLGIGVTRGAEREWLFAGATPLPDLRVGGEAFLDALAECLANGEGEIS